MDVHLESAFFKEFALPDQGPHLGPLHLLAEANLKQVLCADEVEAAIDHTDGAVLGWFEETGRHHIRELVRSDEDRIIVLHERSHRYAELL